MRARTTTTTNRSSGTSAKGHGVCSHGSVGKAPAESTGTALRHQRADTPNPTGLPSAPLCVVGQRNLLLGILGSFADDAADLVSYLDHIGFDVGALRHNRDLPVAWLGHYRRAQADYDTDRACRDLATWPPIATRIRELQQQAMPARTPSPETSGV